MDVQRTLRRLPAMQPHEAHALYEGLSSLIDMLAAMMCQPRFGDRTLNAAGLVLDGLSDDLMAMRDQVLATVAAGEPVDEWDRRMRAEIILRRAVEDVLDWSRIETCAAEMMAAAA